MSFYSVAPFIEKYYPQYYTIEAYPVTECVPFCEVKEEWGVFSNFAPTPIQYDGVTYKNAVHFSTQKKCTETIRWLFYARCCTRDLCTTRRCILQGFRYLQ